jgi:Ca2+-transporting ATPase
MVKKEVYNLSLEEIYSDLRTSQSGLAVSEAKKRFARSGPNEIGGSFRVSAVSVLAQQFKNFMIYVLLVAALISAYTPGNEKEAYVILGIILFVVILGFFEEFKASKDMEALQNLNPKKARVLRNGKKEEIVARELVPGDVIVLERGDIVPADARIISCQDIKIDESVLTGESMHVSKKDIVLKGKISLADQINMVFAGTTILSGEAHAVVFRTGLYTETGKISVMLATVEQDVTPLQKRLNRLTKQITFAVFLVCIFIFTLGLFRGQPWEILLLISLGVLVAGMPESLPAVVTVALALGVKRMAKQKAILKKLPAVETLGATTIICTDKTGTLTQNKMVIENIFTMDDEVTVTGAGYTPEGLFLREDLEIDPKSHRTLSKLIEIGVLCNNSYLKKKHDWIIDGEPTEGALVVMAKKAGIHKEHFEKNYSKVKEHAFDSVRKYMSTVHIYKNKPVVYAKGAPEKILLKCTKYLYKGKIRNFTKKEKYRVFLQNQQYAQKGLRVLALAFKEHKGKNMEVHSVESDLIFVGLVSIRDPPEPSAYESIKMCQEAGIRVVMITGDNPHTAQAIAEDLGIFKKEYIVLTGDDLDSLSEGELNRLLDSVAVFARVTPEHKLKIVERFQNQGHVVAMTGDGVNDAPALKKADIGVAMGRTGTDVAKESADMIILDDNFTTIANAVKEGRVIFENIRKFVYYAMVGGFSAVILMLVSSLIGTAPVLTALMILFVNLITGDFPAFGLCVEQADKNIMKKRPRNVKEGILSDFVLLKIAELLPLITFGSLLLFMVLMTQAASLAKAQTVVFATLVSFQLFNVFNAKSWDESILNRRFFTNHVMLLGVAISLVLLVVTVHWIPAQLIFGTVSLTFLEWVMVIGMASSVLFFREIEKTIIKAEVTERKKMFSD